jgi:hypothetical protein
MDSALPAIAFLVLILAQFAAVIAVKIHPLAEFFPRPDFASHQRLQEEDRSCSVQESSTGSSDLPSPQRSF